MARPGQLICEKHASELQLAAAKGDLRRFVVLAQHLGSGIAINALYDAVKYLAMHFPDVHHDAMLYRLNLLTPEAAKKYSMTDADRREVIGEFVDRLYEQGDVEGASPLFERMLWKYLRVD